MSTHLTFEDDYDSDEFKESNVVSFTYRDQIYKVKRRTLQQLLDDAEESRTSDTRQTTFESWLENNLSTSDYERFWTAFNDPDNPGRTSTLGKIIQAVEAELSGAGDDEQTPKG